MLIAVRIVSRVVPPPGITVTTSAIATMIAMLRKAFTTANLRAR
jgi:hypothetical protein